MTTPSSHMTTILGRLEAMRDELTSLIAECRKDDEMDIMGDGVPQNTQTLLSIKDYLTVRTMDEFKAINAKLGGKIRKQDDWDTWYDMVKDWGWKNVLNAIDRTEPANRWPMNVLQVIHNAKRAKSNVY